MTNTVKTCSTCSSLLSPPINSTANSDNENKSLSNSVPPSEDLEQNKTTVTTTTTTTIVDKTTMCQICLGLMDIDILPQIIEQLKPYNESINNCLINISLPCDILIRSHAVLSFISSKTSSPPALTAERFVSELKECLKKKLSPHRRASSLSKNDEAGVIAIDITARVAGKDSLFPHGILSLPTPKNNNRHYHRGKRSRQHDGSGGMTSSAAMIKALSDPVNTRPSVLQSLLSWLLSLQQEEDDDNNHSDSTTSPLTLDVSLQRRPIYLTGRYIKRKRNISQTPFYVDGIRNYTVAPTSVEEEIIPFVARHLNGGTDTASSSAGTTKPPPQPHVKFHASGREDVNVRMLPPIGRRFGLELIHVTTLPSSTLLATVAEAINEHGKEEGGGVEVTSLEASTPSAFSSLQSDTEGKVKRYGCVCWSERRLGSQEELEGLLLVGGDHYPLPIDQKTPLRVLHRRANLVRPREIVSLDAEWINEHWFKLRISTSAGTYVKEFVHGDLGRTSPSVAEMLGGKADIIQLDVLEIVDDGDGNKKQ